MRQSSIKLAGAAFTLALAGCLAIVTAAWGFPQYERWISKKSGISANCAYCHVNKDGPQGTGPGQIGSLKSYERKFLGTGESPVLNEFGRSLIKRLGYGRVLQGIQDPSAIAAALKAYDLDGDGISDGDEMEHGTLADDPLSAPPSLVWLVRLRRDLGFVCLIGISAVAGAFGLFGLARLTANKNRQ